MLPLSKARQLGTDHTVRKTARRALLLRLNHAWGVCVRRRDGKCVWCGTSKRLNAHHIVARGRGNNQAHCEVENGMTLCFQCHIHRLPREPDEYIRMRDAWLAGRGLDYQAMLIRYTMGMGTTLDNDELEVVVVELERRAGIKSRKK